MEFLSALCYDKLGYVSIFVHIIVIHRACNLCMSMNSTFETLRRYVYIFQVL